MRQRPCTSTQTQGPHTEMASHIWHSVFAFCTDAELGRERALVERGAGIKNLGRTLSLHVDFLRVSAYPFGRAKNK